MTENKLTPAMPEMVFNFLKAQLSESRVYLEYGCGGSTYHASLLSNISRIYSVDTSSAWIEKVKNDISSDKLFIEYCDVGPVIEWGTPSNNASYKNYWSYMTIPWKNARNFNDSPDLILIDGRFRVASFLYSVLCAKKGAKILFDDYTIRPEYHIVEKYLPINEVKGYMALFEIKEKTFQVEEVCADIAKYSVESK